MDLLSLKIESIGGISQPQATRGGVTRNTLDDKARRELGERHEFKELKRAD